MSKFLDKLNNEYLYDAYLLYMELNQLQSISEQGNTLIQQYILDLKPNAHKIEFGILNQQFFIQVIVKTLSTNKMAFDTDFIKFTYPITNDKIEFNTDIDKQIFHFYKIQIYQYLLGVGIRY